MEAFLDNLIFFGVFMMVLAVVYVVGEFVSDHIITPWMRQRDIMNGAANRHKMMNTEYERRTGLRGASPWDDLPEEYHKPPQSTEEFNRLYMNDWPMEEQPPMTKDEEFEETTRRG